MPPAVADVKACLQNLTKILHFAYRGITETVFNVSVFRIIKKIRNINISCGPEVITLPLLLKSFSQDLYVSLRKCQWYCKMCEGGGGGGRGCPALTFFFFFFLVGTFTSFVGTNEPIKCLLNCIIVKISDALTKY